MVESLLSPETPPAHPLCGTWKMVRAELAGEPAHPLLVDNTTVVVVIFFVAFILIYF